MQNEMPREAQAVQVRVGAGTWQAATYRDGRFIDRFGLTLNPAWITAWEAIGVPTGVHNDDAPGDDVRHV